MKKYTYLFLLLVLPAIFYMYLTRGENNFMTLEFIGPENHKIPEFSFINQNNDIITKSDYEGHIYVANFFFTSCPSICPIMINNMRYVQNELKVYPNIKFLSHTVDPANDSPEKLLEYSIKMRADLSNWNFVTGERDDIYNVAKEYFVSASEDASAEGGFLHSESFILIDKEGRIRSGTEPFAVYDGTKDLDIKHLIEDIKVLMAEYKKPKKHKDENQ